MKDFKVTLVFALSYFGDLLLGPHSDWALVQFAMHVTSVFSALFILKREIEQIKLSVYSMSFWNKADLCLILLYLGAFLPLNYLHAAFDDMTVGLEPTWKLVNFLIIILTFVRVNRSLQIFDNFSFLVQMVQAVFYDLRLFLAYYLIVMITFSFILMIVFNDPNKDSEGLGPLSYVLMSLRIVWGEGSFDIE